MQRTHTCGELRGSFIGEPVTLCGWVENRRDHGGLVFVDLRDRYGLTQVVFDPEECPDSIELAHHIRSEWVLKIEGVVQARPAGTVNPKMLTGEIEVRTRKGSALSKAKTPPFEIIDNTSTNEELRLKYRFLDLRRPIMQKNFIARHTLMQSARASLSSQGFLEFDTPILGKSTPEGARDYLVPSRVHHGEFYALPQSPQIFKQILMVSGFDRYFQICRCFRDEDLRADRQPEFTQIDIEMSFAEQEDIFRTVETLLVKTFKDTLNHDLPVPCPRMRHADAMDRYGCDKPDLRFGMELFNVADLVSDCEFNVFTQAIASKGIVKAVRGPGMNSYSRKQMDDLSKLVAVHGAKGLAYVKIDEKGEFSGPIVKFFKQEKLTAIAARVSAKPGDVIMFGADRPEVVNPSLALLRNHLGRELKLYDPKVFHFVWITEFPLLEWSEERKRWESSHHPFTMPHVDDIPLLAQVGSDRDLKLRSSSYDLVLNGVELASGSIRIHDSEIQRRVFQALQITDEDIRERFGFFIDALQYGTPPHAGIALGLDRMIAMMLGHENIREVIAFPKTQRATCLMTGAPGEVAAEQLRDLGLSLRKQQKEDAQ